MGFASLTFRAAAVPASPPYDQGFDADWLMKVRSAVFFLSCLLTVMDNVECSRSWIRIASRVARMQEAEEEQLHH